MSELKFYFDESVELAVSEQLAAAGLDVVSVHSLEALGEEDIVHLKRAIQMGRIIYTYDSDFLRLAKEISDHRGIIFAQAEKASIGAWQRELRALHSRLTAEQLEGQIIFLSSR